jgi:hypothetical protein
MVLTPLNTPNKSAERSDAPRASQAHAPPPLWLAVEGEGGSERLWAWRLLRGLSEPSDGESTPMATSHTT